jgi:hypothetical protein
MPLNQEFTDIKEQNEANELLQEMLDLDHGLSSWEIGFIQTLDEWEGHFTYGQYVKLKEVHARHF